MIKRLLAGGDTSPAAFAANALRAVAGTGRTVHDPVGAHALRRATEIGALAPLYIAAVRVAGAACPRCLGPLRVQERGVPICGGCRWGYGALQLRMQDAGLHGFDIPGAGVVGAEPGEIAWVARARRPWWRKLLDRALDRARTSA